jgi:hypothetical protein
MMVFFPVYKYTWEIQLVIFYYFSLEYKQQGMKALRQKKTRNESIKDILWVHVTSSASCRG